MNKEAPLNRRQVVRTFKMRGLALQAAALDAMMNVLQREHSTNDVLTAILDELGERRLQQPIVTEELLAHIVADMSRDGRDVHEEALQLLDAYDTPCLTYDTMRKQFSLVRHQNRSYFGKGDDKVRCVCYFYYGAMSTFDSLINVTQADMFAQRFALVQQRILRQDLFRPKLVTADGRSGDGRNVTHAITPVESLLGRGGIKFLLGMIVQVRTYYQRWYLLPRQSKHSH